MVATTKKRPAKKPAVEQEWRRTPIWDDEFADRWNALHEDDPETETPSRSAGVTRT